MAEQVELYIALDADTRALLTHDLSLWAELSNYKKPDEIPQKLVHFTPERKAALHRLLQLVEHALAHSKP